MLDTSKPLRHHDNMLAIAIEAARAAGQIIKEQFHQSQESTEKADGTLVTETDKAAEKAIIDIIQSTYPDHSIFSEESGLIKKSASNLWVIDPLDGTSNFARHLPNVAVSIALIQNQEAVLGVVYDPLGDELFTGEKGRGAHANGAKIKVSSETELAKAIASFGRGSKNKQRLGPIIAGMNASIRTPRILGSTALNICYVASGRFDININNDCYLYDCLAASLIAQEAGATLLDFAGTPWRPKMNNPTSISDLIVANEDLALSAATILKEMHV